MGSSLEDGACYSPSGKLGSSRTGGELCGSACVDLLGVCPISAIDENFECFHAVVNNAWSSREVFDGVSRTGIDGDGSKCADVVIWWTIHYIDVSSVVSLDGVSNLDSWTNVTALTFDGWSRSLLNCGASEPELLLGIVCSVRFDVWGFVLCDLYVCVASFGGDGSARSVIRVDGSACP